MEETYVRSRLEIMNCLVNFCIPKYFGEKTFSFNNKEWAFRGDHFDKQNPPIGSLCMLNSAPTSKYYLGWLKEIKEDESRYSTQFLIQSIEDGSLCWWHNVSIWYLPLETSNKYPDWKWTDRQFEFKDRWFNACYKKRDAYITLPLYPVFDGNGGVTLGTRTRFSLDEYRPEKYFPNWKKLTTKAMLEFYDECIANKEAAKKLIVDNNIPKE